MSQHVNIVYLLLQWSWWYSDERVNLEMCRNHSESNGNSQNKLSFAAAVPIPLNLFISPHVQGAADTTSSEANDDSTTGRSSYSTKEQCSRHLVRWSPGVPPQALEPQTPWSSEVLDQGAGSTNPAGADTGGVENAGAAKF